MIPHLARGGRSFLGAFLYLIHDTDTKSHNRVAWTETINILTDDPDRAWKVMAYTVKVQEQLKATAGIKRTGRKLSKPVLHLSLSWHPEQKPTKDEMLSAAHHAIAAIGMSEHEALLVAHNDREHAHVHLLLNRVHPVTGLVASDSNLKRKLSAFAAQYELEHGKLYCKRPEPKPSIKDNFNKGSQVPQRQIDELNLKHETILRHKRMELERFHRLGLMQDKMYRLNDKINGSGCLSRIFGLNALHRRRLKRLQRDFDRASEHCEKVLRSIRFHQHQKQQSIKRAQHLSRAPP